MLAILLHTSPFWVIVLGSVVFGVALGDGMVPMIWLSVAICVFAGGFKLSELLDRDTWIGTVVLPEAWRLGMFAFGLAFFTETGLPVHWERIDLQSVFSALSVAAVLLRPGRASLTALGVLHALWTWSDLAIYAETESIVRSVSAACHLSTAWLGFKTAWWGP